MLVKVNTILKCHSVITGNYHGGDVTNSLVVAERNEQRILHTHELEHDACYDKIWRQVCIFGI